MRRVGKGFSGVDTPLFKGMIVAQQVDESAAEVNIDDVPTAGVAAEGAACNTPKLARSGILVSGRATSWINNTRYILNDQKVV
nr:hypothetical protein [Tanacetum cinerariifolium]